MFGTRHVAQNAGLYTIIKPIGLARLGSGVAPTCAGTCNKANKGSNIPLVTDAARYTNARFRVFRFGKSRSSGGTSKKLARAKRPVLA